MSEQKAEAKKSRQKTKVDLGATATKEPITKKSKVCIVGCASSRNKVPWDDSDMEFWGVNNLFLSESNRPWSRWYEVHFIDKDEKGKFRRRFNNSINSEPLVFRGQKVDNYIEDLGKLPIPVYMQQLWPEVPNAVQYPIQDILKAFPRAYFTNTISYQMALAIMEGFKEIHIYGVDMAVSSKILLSDEYSHQRPSCEYFLGIAEGMGIKVYIPDSSDLLKARFLYGFQEPQATAFDNKLDDMVNNISGQINKADAQINELTRKREQGVGARLAVLEIKKIWQNG